MQPEMRLISKFDKTHLAIVRTISRLHYHSVMRKQCRA